MPSHRSNRAGQRPDVWRIVGMEVVSGIGDGVFWVGLIAVLLDRAVGVEGFAVAALVRLGPRALISAPAGALADRFDRRRLLVGLDLARGAVMVALAATSASGGGLGVMLGGVLVAYTLAAPYRPALSAALPLVAGERKLSSATALVGTSRQLMTFIGPVAGAIAVKVTSPTVAFSINAATFVVSALLIASVRGLGGGRSNSSVALGAHRAEWSQQFAGGWREVTATPGLIVLSVLIFVMYTVRGAELVLFALVAEQRLSLGRSGVGVLTAAVGLGALCALPAGARIARTGRPDVVVLVSLATTAVPTMLLGILRAPWSACTALFSLGFGLVAFEVVSAILVQRLAEPRMLGRVFGLVGTASNAGKLLGALLAPAVVLALDLSETLVAIGAAVGLAGVLTVRGLVALTGETRAQAAALQPIVDVLSTLGVFDGASPVSLEQLAAAVHTETASAGTIVVRENEPADDMYVIRSGDFVVTDRGRPINTMRPNDWFGEIGLLQRSARTATVIAATDAVLWRIPGATFLEALEDTSTEPAALMDVMADRLNRSAALGGHLPSTSPT